MTMHPDKIYRARFRWFCGSPATTFARQTPETLPVCFRGADNGCYGKSQSVVSLLLI